MLQLTNNINTQLSAFVVKSAVICFLNKIVNFGCPNYVHNFIEVKVDKIKGF